MDYYLNLSDGQSLSAHPCLAFASFTLSLPLAGALTANATGRACGSSIQGSVVFPLDVYPDPVLAPVQSSFNGTPSSSADQGQSAQFSVSGTRGAPPYSFSWTGLPAQGCTIASANGSSVATCTHLAENVTGLAVQATLTDNNSFSVTTPTLTFPVLPDPAVAVPLAQGPSGSIASGDTGQVVSFEASAKGGSGIFSVYHWTGLPPGQCWGTTTATVDCLLGSPTSTPTRVRVAVTDSNGFTSPLSPALSFSVYAAPTATPPVAILAGEVTDSVDAGQTVTLSTSVAGGAGGGALVWHGLPPGCPAGTGPTLTCTASQAGSYSVLVSGTDGNGVPFTSSPLSLTVFRDPTVDLPLVSHDSRDVGQTVSFQAGASNGTGDYSRFLWSGLPTGSCSGLATASVVCALSAAGTYNISVAVTDTNGMSSSPSRPVTLVVAPALVVSPPAVTPGRTLVGTTVTFQANLTGGAGPLTFTWHGLPPGCAPTNRSSLSCPVQTEGTYAIWYQVRDQNGVSSTSGATLLAMAPVSLPPPPSPPTVLGIPSTAGYTLLGTLVLALVLGAVLALLVLRKPKDAGRGPPPPGGGTVQGPPARVEGDGPPEPAPGTEPPP